MAQFKRLSDGKEVEVIKVSDYPLRFIVQADGFVDKFSLRILHQDYEPLDPQAMGWYHSTGDE